MYQFDRKCHLKIFPEAWKPYASHPAGNVKKIGFALSLFGNT